MSEPSVTPPVVETSPTVTSPPTSETPPLSLIGEQPQTEPPALIAEFVPLTAESFKIPEGLSASPEATNKFIGILNDQALTGEARAQALIDLQGEVLNQASEANSKAWGDLQTQWQNEVRADPTIGGANLQTTLTSIGKLVDQFGTPALREAMDSTGAGNHPEMIRFLAKVSTLLTEGTHVLGDPAGGAVSAAERMFPSMKGK